MCVTPGLGALYKLLFPVAIPPILLSTVESAMFRWLPGPLYTSWNVNLLVTVVLIFKITQCLVSLAAVRETVILFCKMYRTKVGLKDRQQLYKLIISQLLYDGYISIANGLINEIKPFIGVRGP